MCLGMYTCEFTVDVAADSHNTGYKDGLVKVLASAMRQRAYFDNTSLPDNLPPITASNRLFGISEASSAISRMHACMLQYTSHETMAIATGAGRCQDSLAVRNAMTPARILGQALPRK